MLFLLKEAINKVTNKKDLSERDIVTQFIIPNIVHAGWDLETQVREEVYFTDGRIFVKGNKTARGERKRADIILFNDYGTPAEIISVFGSKENYLQAIWELETELYKAA
jgi:type I restriction enzyme R subunit